MVIFFKISISKANHRIRLFLLAPILFFFHLTNAQSDSNINLQTAFSQFLNFQLDSCSESLTVIPPSPLTFYLEILVTSANIFIKDDFDQYKANKSLESELLEKLNELNFSDSYTNFLKSEIKLQWAILKLKNGEEFSSFWSLRHAYNIAKENVIKNPEFLPSYKTLGLLHVLYGVFPDKYNWILSILGIEGNVHAGLSELDKVYKSDQLLSLECGITVALLQAYLLNDPVEGADQMRIIHAKKKQLLIDYAFALILMKNAQSERALNIIDDSEYIYTQPFILPQLYYLKGEVLLQKGHLDEAIKNYQIFISRHEGQNLVKDTYYKIGVCYLIKDMPDSTKKYFERSWQKGWAKNEADKNAKNALESDHNSTKELYQLRYASDGGFYEKALKIHEQIDTINLNEHDKCEYYYRTARLYHKTGNIENAVSNYHKTIKFQKNTNWYYAPNSALQLGLICLSENNNETAIEYLQLVNNYSGYPYQNSIRQKVKTTLKELE